jgi:2-C-methyl-D-erythritol 4-phosphate cytidylyltransferase
MKKFALIVAGGSGLRMGASSPKQFLLLKGKPLLRHTIDAFLDAYNDMQVILVLPKDYLEFGNTMIAEMVDKNRIQITIGGATRFHSVQNGLKLINETSIIFVHDGVRSLVSKTLIQQCFEQAVEKGSAIPAVAATDSIRQVNGEENSVANRNNIRIIQTPQTFKSDILLPAFNQGYEDKFTDEATVVEAFGTKIFLCEGDYNNIKITRPIDLLVAENILSQL